MKKGLFISALMLSGCVFANAQENKGLSTFIPDMANFRANDQTGINVFETSKDNDAVYDGMKVRIGAAFTAQWQNLHSSNTATNNVEMMSPTTLYPLAAGFMTPQANMYLDVQLADGIRLNVTTYMASRHHNETWVKGGYLQIDKLPFRVDFLDNIMKYTTIKVGQYDVNYGDMHYRRSDGGQTLQNPFMEGNILDAFATEIGGDIFIQNKGFFGMVGITNGQLNGNVDTLKKTIANPNAIRQPSLILKAGFDKQLNEHLRTRLSASWYHNGSAGNGTLTFYGGDRTGSNYQNAYDVYYYKGVKNSSTSGNAKSSGRLDPGFKQQIDAAMINAFVKYDGLEFFGTYENTSGRGVNEVSSRNIQQYAGELVYRFNALGAKENLFLGTRYNVVNGDLDAARTGINKDVTVDRLSFAGGWFLTKNILMKGEYVIQKYKDFDVADIRNGGEFKGFVIEAAISF